MVSRVSYSTGRGQTGSNFPSLRGNHVPKLNLQFSLNEFSTDGNKLFGNFKKGQVKSAPPTKSQKTKIEMATSSMALGKMNLPERGKPLLRRTKESSRIGTPKATRTLERNASKNKDCREYVRDYANVRIFGSGKKNENVLLAKRREKYETNTEVEIPLKFSGDVIEERGDIHRFPYSKNNPKTLFIYKRNFNKPTRAGNNRETRGIIPRHKTCLPVEEEFSFVRPDPTYLYKNQSHLQKEDEEEEGEEGGMNFSLIWEQHLLSLVSKTTAQWIANQCSMGEQRERLICFLDEFYDEKEPGVSGAGSVRKLVDIDDDCITPPRTRNTEKTGKLMVRESRSY